MNGLSDKFDFNLVNFNKGNFNHGINSLNRVFEILKILSKICKSWRKTDVVYLTLSQSLAGNFKDCIIIWLTRKKPQIVHLHGSGIGNIVFQYRLFRYINRYVYRWVDRVIVLSDSLSVNFIDIISRERISIVANGVSPDLYIKRENLQNKFKEFYPVRFLFMSNLIPGKGFNELLYAAKILNKQGTSRPFTVTFIGQFLNDIEKDSFLHNISSESNIDYLGFVLGEEKRRLLHRSHVFILPSSYPYEGQPISILEAYASGCSVITTNQGGILDIFKDDINGVLLKDTSSNEIVDAMKWMINHPEKCLKYSEENFVSSSVKFTSQRYLNNIEKLFFGLLRH